MERHLTYVEREWIEVHGWETTYLRTVHPDGAQPILLHTAHLGSVCFEINAGCVRVDMVPHGQYYLQESYEEVLALLHIEKG